MQANIVGFVWGLVADNQDPLKCGRVKVHIPGLYDKPNTHPEWVKPVGWPGAGGTLNGSRYPVDIGAQVIVLFEAGSVEAPPVYLPGIYGLGESGVLGPQAALTHEDPNTRAVIWEDDVFQSYITTGTASQPNAEDRRLVLKEKRTGSGITINATDGTNHKSVSVDIQANTSLKIHCNGIIDIDGTVVQINGRKVLRKPGVTTI